MPIACTPRRWTRGARKEPTGPSRTVAIRRPAELHSTPVAPSGASRPHTVFHRRPRPRRHVRVHIGRPQSISRSYLLVLLFWILRCQPGAFPSPDPQSGSPVRLPRNCLTPASTKLCPHRFRRGHRPSKRNSKERHQHHRLHLSLDQLSAPDQLRQRCQQDRGTGQSRTHPRKRHTPPLEVYRQQRQQGKRREQVQQRVLIRDRWKQNTRNRQAENLVDGWQMTDTRKNRATNAAPTTRR